MTDLVARRAPEHGEPAAAPGLEPAAAPGLVDTSDGPPAVAPAASSDGVELDRFLALARLSAPQALVIAAGVLAEAAWRFQPEPGIPGRALALPGRVVIGIDGQVGLRPAEDGRENGSSGASAASGPALGTVLATIAGAARRPSHEGDPAPDPLLAELDRVVTELPVAGVAEAAQRLGRAVAAIDGSAVRAELAALARAISGHARSPGDPAPAGDRPYAPPAAPRAAPPAALPWPTGERTPAWGRRIGAWGLSILAIAAIVVLEVATLRDNIAADVHQLLDAGRDESAPSTASSPDGRPVPSFAPAAAGAVTAVDLRPLAQCVPGAPCSLRFLVQVAPAADQQVVRWSYRIVDRCTGASSTAPGGSVAVPASGDRAAAVGVVPLPASRAAAVVAVTEVPAATASPPVLVGSCRPGP